MAVGVINGFFVAIVGISSFVTTLGMLFAFEGLTLIISHGQPVATPGAQVHATTHNVTHVVNGVHIVLPETVNHISTFAKVFGGGIYSELIWALVMRDRAAGRADVHALGSVHGVGRLEQARRRRGGRAGAPGDDPQLHPVRDHGRARGHPRGGALAAPSSRTRPGRTKSCSTAIAAAVIGGTLLAGGSGTVVGALIGALFLGILHDGLIAAGRERELPAVLHWAWRSSWR